MSTVPSLFLPQVLCTFVRRWMYSHLHYHRLQRADLSATDTRCEPCGPFRDWQREERDSTLLTNQDVWKCQTERMKRAKCFLTEKWRDCGTLNGSITRARVAAAQKKNAFLSPLNFDFGAVRIQKITGRAKGKRISRVLDWTSIDNWSDAFLTQHENAKHWNKQHAVVQFERVITNLFGAVLRLLFPRKEAKETKRRQIRSIDEKQLLKDNDAIVKMYKSWQAEIKKNWRRRGFLKKSFFFPFKFVFLLFLCFDHSRVR